MGTTCNRSRPACKGATPTSVWDGSRFVAPHVDKCHGGIEEYRLGPSMDYRFEPLRCWGRGVRSEERCQLRVYSW
jgi:hemerythrin-like domain-containing protein